MNLKRKKKLEQRERERERERERAFDRDYPTMYRMLREGRGFAATVASNTKISITDRNKHTSMPFDRIICSEMFRIQDEFLHFFKYNFICTKRKRIIAI